MLFDKCEKCGAYLDPGEKCDCEEVEQEQDNMKSDNVQMLIARFLDIITKKEKPLGKATNPKNNNDIVSKTEDNCNDENKQVGN